MIGWLFRRAVVWLAGREPCRVPRCGRAASQDGLCLECLGPALLDSVARGA